MNQETQFIFYPRCYRKSMKCHDGRRRVISRSKAVNEANSGIDDPLQWGECGVMYIYIFFKHLCLYLVSAILW